LTGPKREEEKEKGKEFLFIFRINFHEKYSKNSKNSRKIPRDRLEHEQSK
jgi:hypothetical protein